MALTPNAVDIIHGMKESRENPNFNPIFQILNVKAVAMKTGQTQERFRIVLSDGTSYIQGILMATLNHLIHDGSIKMNSIIQVNNFLINILSGKTVVIIMGLNVIQSDCVEGRIGDPKEASAAPPSGSPNNNNNQQPLRNATNQSSYSVQPSPAYSNNNSFNKNGNSGNNNNSPGMNRYQNNFNSPAKNGYNNNRSSSAPIVHSSMGTSPGGVRFTPIASLNMYQNRWTIKARITSKSDIRTWSNAKGEGCLFSMELLDSSGMDVRATMFKEAVDKFYNMLEEGKVYTLSGGRLKVANAQYNTCKSNFEITFDQNSEIHLVQQDDGDIVKQMYDFTKIVDVENKEANAFVDLIAFVKNVGEPTSLISKKSGKELLKCDLTLIDDSNTEINLTLWGDKATEAPVKFGPQNNDPNGAPPIVAFRRCRVSDYGGKSLSLSGSADANPELPQEENILQQWWANVGGKGGAPTKSLSGVGGGNNKFVSLFDRKDIISIKDDHLGHNPDGKPDWISFKGTISFLKKDKEGGAWYPACSNAGEPCKNLYKVSQTTDGQWHCDKCSTTYPSCTRRWIFSGTVEDGTSSTWVSFFNDQAIQLFGGADDVLADTVYQNTMNPDSPNGQNIEDYDAHFLKATFTEWIFRCRVKSEMVNDEARIKTSVYGMRPVDYARESQDLITAIEKLAVGA